eukprot:c24033_g2_i1 orf=1-672(-)
MEGALQRSLTTVDLSRQQDVKCKSNNFYWVHEELQMKGTDSVVRSTLVGNAELVVIPRRKLEEVKEIHKEAEQAEDEEEAQEVANSNHQKAQQNICDPVILVSLLKDCAKQKDLQRGSKIHAVIVKRDLLKRNTFLGNALVNFYAKCSALSKALEVFDQLVVRDVVSWNSLIAGYVQHENDEEALDCFEFMQRQGFSPNAVTFTCILKACTRLGAADKGQEIHA